MKTNIITKRIKAATLRLLTVAVSLLCGGGVGGVLVSCSDWDDHFESNTTVLNSQNATLWHNIEQNGKLTQFADLLKKTGYDERLKASQTYTVWAPEDNTFDYQTVLSYSKERMVKEFVENHIARNNYPVSGAIDKNIYMLNEKMMHFSGNSSYQIQNLLLKQLNIGSSNGTLHTIDGRMNFLSNIYEALDILDYPLDSISNYIHSFDEKIINEDKSKKGPVVNGEQTYLDTIYNEHNDLFTMFNAYINREDSSYTMVLPTDKAWNDALARIRSYCQYRATFTTMEDVEESKTVKVTLKDANAMTDSVAKVCMMASLVYNNNTGDNRRLKGLAEGASADCDSLVTTTGQKMYAEDARRLLTNARRVEMSNGAAWITDSLRLPTWTIWNPEIRLEAETPSLWAGYGNINGTPIDREVTQQNPEVAGSVSKNHYIELEPQSRNANPEIYFRLPGVRSATYNIYIVTVPGNINSRYFAEELKQNFLTCTIGYADQTGGFSYKSFDNVITGVDSLKTAGGTYTAKVDTTLIGEFTFPVSYLGMTSGQTVYAPYIRVRSKVRNADSYDRTLRIDCLLLRPKELDDYLKEHPDYEYDKN